MSTLPHVHPNVRSEGNLNVLGLCLHPHLASGGDLSQPSTHIPGGVGTNMIVGGRRAATSRDRRESSGGDRLAIL